MEVRAVTAAHYEGDKLVALKMGLVDGSRNTWITEPIAVPVIDVVDRLMGGNRVVTVFPVNGVGPETVPGPNLRVIVLDHGRESVEVEGELKTGRAVTDLPRF